MWRWTMYIDTHFSVSSPSQGQSQGVVCIITPRKRVFLTKTIKWHCAPKHQCALQLTVVWSQRSKRATTTPWLVLYYLLHVHDQRPWRQPARSSSKCSPHSLSIFLPRPRKLPQECCLYVVGKNGAKTTIFQPVGSRNLINGFSYWRRRSLTGGLYNNIFRINSYSRLRKGIFRTVNWCPFELLVKSTLEYVTYSAHTNKGRR